jgi:hypothetical protein
MRRIGLDYAAAVRAGGGSVDVIDLPEAGIKGNSHFPMLDRNNDDVFALIETWLADKGLTG